MSAGHGRMELDAGQVACMKLSRKMGLVLALEGEAMVLLWSWLGLWWVLAAVVQDMLLLLVLVLSPSLHLEPFLTLMLLPPRLYMNLWLLLMPKFLRLHGWLL